MLMGTYEKACRPWSEHETPWDFGHELLEPDIDRIAPSLEVGFQHFPAFQTAGIKQIVNGPFTFAPDGNPGGSGARAARILVCLRGDGGLLAGGRGRPHRSELDGGRRPRRRRVRDGRGALRGLGDPLVHQRQGAGELLAALLHPLPQRGAARGPATVHHPALRPARGGGGAVRGRLRPRSAAVVRPARRGGRVLVAAFHRLRARRGGVRGGARTGRTHGHLRLREVHGHRRGRAGLARPHLRLPHPEAGADDPCPDAQGRRPDHRRPLARQPGRGGLLHRGFRHRRGLPHALVRPAPARERLGLAERGALGPGRALRGRASGP